MTLRTQVPFIHTPVLYIALRKIVRVIAGMLLTTECVISDVQEEEKGGGGMPNMGGMGGMM